MANNCGPTCPLLSLSPAPLLLFAFAIHSSVDHFHTFCTMPFWSRFHRNHNRSQSPDFGRRLAVSSGQNASASKSVSARHPFGLHHHHRHSSARSSSPKSLLRLSSSSHPHQVQFRSRDFDRDRWWRDWPTDWPRMDAIVPRFSSHLDRFDRNWRDDPFWRDLYPRWAEPIFKDGIDVKTNITNDSNRFAVEMDTYQFRPEELQVKTMDDTLLIEGRHEDVRDRDNYTKMYFVRKYQLPADVESHSISSHIDSSGRLSVEAQKRWQAVEGERSIPIESGSRRQGGGYGSRSSSYSPRDRYYADSGRGSANDYYRAESRLNGAANGGGGYLSPNPRSDGYRTEFEKRETDANGMRHEARREEFREEFRRSGSAANVLPPASPMLRTESRLSGAVGANASSGEERRESSQFRRTASAASREYRSGGAFAGGENLLRPAEELGGRSSAFGTRNVPIHRG